MLSKFHCKSKNKHKNQYIAECIIRHPIKQFSQLLCEILGVDMEHLNKKTREELAVEQVKPKESKVGFLKIPDYSDDDKDTLCSFLTNLFMILIGEGD